MSDIAGHTWACSGCGRRVPQRATACHCGTSREQSLAAQRPARAAATPRPAVQPEGWRGVWGSLPADVKALAVAAALVMAVGLGWLTFGPSRPNETPALLGYVDRPLAARRPVPAPVPPFKLPWWK
jgi:hypothetical protein